VNDEQASALAQALSNPLRLAILRELRGRDRMSPSEYATRSGEALSNVSYHVRTLESAGIIAVTDTQARRGALEHFFPLPVPTQRRP
jgi:DNA-binding transcriptional ArsR family regulator